MSFNFCLNNLHNLLSNISLGLFLKLTLLSFSQIIFRIEEYFKNGRTSVVLNPHDSLLQKQSDGTETGTTNQHAQKRVLIKVFPAITLKRILDEVSCKLVCYTAVFRVVTQCSRSVA